MRREQNQSKWGSSGAVDGWAESKQFCSVVVVCLFAVAGEAGRNQGHADTIWHE